MGNAESSSSLPNNRATGRTVSLVLENRAKVPFGDENLTLQRWLWSNEALDIDLLNSNTNYVQWLLPVDSPSSLSPKGPVVGPAEIAHATSESWAQLDNIVKSATLLLALWGVNVHLVIPLTSSVSLDGSTTPTATPTRPKAGVVLSYSKVNADQAGRNLAKEKHHVATMLRLVRCLRLFKFHHMAVDALVLLNSMMCALGESDSSFPHRAKFFVDHDGVLRRFVNEEMSNEFVTLNNLIEEQEKSDATTAAAATAEGKSQVLEEMYFEQVGNTSLFDFAEYARHVSTKMWKNRGSNSSSRLHTSSVTIEQGSDVE